MMSQQEELEKASKAEETEVEVSGLEQEALAPASEEVEGDQQETAAPVEESATEEASQPVEPEQKDAAQSSASSEEPAPQEKKESRPVKPSPEWDHFQEVLVAAQSSEEKLTTIVDFMEMSLAQAGTPNFRNFWEARKLCIDLFKEQINPAVRSQLWERYSELSKEARRLKELLDKETAFAVEQIDMAIGALEGELDLFDEELERQELVHLEEQCEALEHRSDFYAAIQRELTLLNTFAGRINGLRKELIKTDMRIRQKNKFFQRLSAAGDRVFPRRKELIKEVSEAFIEDVDHFVGSRFNDAPVRGPLFKYREEIKALQGIAKHLTLNTHAFTHTRKALSQCWDKIKDQDKERKQFRAQKKAVFVENMAVIEKSIEEFVEEYSQGEMSLEAAQKSLGQIVSNMRQIELGREEVTALKEKLAEARKPIDEKLEAEEAERRAKEEERRKQVQEQVEGVEGRIAELLAGTEEMEVEAILAAKQELMKTVSSLPVARLEKQRLETLLKPLKDVIADKKEKALLNLSDDDRQALSQLRQLLEERQNRRKEIQESLDHARRSQKASGLDFEQAFALQEQIQEERVRLEKVNQGISEVEKQVREFEAKVEG